MSSSEIELGMRIAMEIGIYLSCLKYIIWSK